MNQEAASPKPKHFCLACDQSAHTMHNIDWRITDDSSGVIYSSLSQKGFS